MSFSDDPKMQIGDRDGRHCQECGLPVLQLHSGIQQKGPRSQRGEDDQGNGIILCLPCRAIKFGHTFILAEITIDQYPQYIKQLARELGLDLAAFAERLDRKRPPSGPSVSEWINGAIQTLQFIRYLTDEYTKAGIGSGEASVPDDLATVREQNASSALDKK